MPIRGNGWISMKRRPSKEFVTALQDGWVTHTEHHWSRDLNGKRLNYWPSRNKFQYDGRVMCGDVYGFIKDRETEQ